MDSDSENNNRSLNNNHDDNYENESTSTVINNNEHLNSKLKRIKSPSAAAVISSVFNEETLNPSERYRKSIDNCAAWLKSTPNVTSPLEQPKPAFKKINLPDMSQPPPPLLANYKRTGVDHQPSTVSSSNVAYSFLQSTSNSVDSILHTASKRMKASTPPTDQNRLTLLNPLVKQNEVSSASEVFLFLQKNLLFFSLFNGLLMIFFSPRINQLEKKSAKDRGVACPISEKNIFAVSFYV